MSLWVVAVAGLIGPWFRFRRWFKGWSRRWIVWPVLWAYRPLPLIVPTSLLVFGPWLADRLAPADAAAGVRELYLSRIGLFAETASAVLLGVVWLFGSRKLGRDSVCEQLKNYSRSAPWRGRRVVNMTGTAVLGGMTATAHGTVRPHKDATTEQRVEFLMRRVEDLDRLAHNMRTKFEESAKDAKRELERVESEAKQALEALRNELLGEHFGRTGIDKVRILALVSTVQFGIVFATIPDVVFACYGY